MSTWLLAGGSMSAGVAFSIDNNLVTAVGALMATVAVTLAIVRWIDERIEHKINNAMNIIRGDINALRVEVRNRGSDET
jgi:hypothetical protein